MNKKGFINIICPVSETKVNENAARISAAGTIIIAALGLYFNSFLIFAFLAADFSIRAYTPAGSSPIKYITQLIVNFLKIKNKPIGAAQKKFAAELGFILSIAICLLMIFGNYLAVNILGFILIFFAFLEAVFNFCFGCVVYTYIALPLLRKEKSK
jgi:hypothetical protein